MSRSLSLVCAASALVFAEETRIASDNSEDKQFWIGNRFRRPFPLRTRHKPYLPNTIQSPRVARDAADRFLFGWNQGNEAAIVRLFATGAFVEDYSMLSAFVRTDGGASLNNDDYLEFWGGNYERITGYKNVTAYATAMSCMTRSDVTTDDDCCKVGTDKRWEFLADFCSVPLFGSTDDKRNRVVETSFTATSDGFVAEYKYMIPAQNAMLEFDFAIKTAVDNYGRFRRLSVYSNANSFNPVLNGGSANGGATASTATFTIEVDTTSADDVCALSSDPDFITTVREAVADAFDVDISQVIVNGVTVTNCARRVRRLLGEHYDHVISVDVIILEDDASCASEGGRIGECAAIADISAFVDAVTGVADSASTVEESSGYDFLDAILD